MIDEICNSGNWDILGHMDVWGGAGLILNVVFWVGLLAGLILLFVLATKGAWSSAAMVSSASGQPTAREILQTQYARGEITREQYVLKKQDIGLTKGLID